MTKRGKTTDVLKFNRCYCLPKALARSLLSVQMGFSKHLGGERVVIKDTLDPDRTSCLDVPRRRKESWQWTSFPISDELSFNPSWDPLQSRSCMLGSSAWVTPRLKSRLPSQLCFCLLEGGPGESPIHELHTTDHGSWAQPQHALVQPSSWHGRCSLEPWAYITPALACR